MLSSPIVITAPGEDLFYLDEVKTFCRVDGDELDAEIEGHIKTAIGDIERITSTRLQLQTIEIRADSFADLDHLPIGPCSAITSIAYQDETGTTSTIDAEVYEMFGAGLDRGIRLQAGQRWPSVRAVAGAIIVQLVVGYDDDAAIPLPPNIRQLALLTARAKFDGTAIDLFTATVNDRIWL